MRKPDVDLRAVESLLDRVFGTGTEYSCRRAPAGSSTQVYQVVRGSETFYLRIGETADYSLTPEAELHRALVAAGARVPRVVHYEPFYRPLERSTMVITEIPGGPLDASTPTESVEAISRAAGRDLARIHDVPVDGFGWIRRDHGQPGWPLRGEHSTYAAYVDPAAITEPLLGIGFTAAEVTRAEALLAEAIAVGPSGPIGSVAHGDFDTSHIFARNGAYTGMIDFGEIRGTDYTFDFATLMLNKEEHFPAVRLRQYIEQGYSEARVLPDDHERRLYLACVLSASHRLTTWFRRDGAQAGQGWFFRWIRDRLCDLLATGDLPDATKV